MCLSPGTLPNGQQVACRKCKLCLHNRVKDWAGRNIAESKKSTASFACDLTYGPELDENRMPIKGRSDHIRAAVLTYSDVQNFLKYLRSHLGYRVGYFITGEMGSLKGRAHWHIILHFRGKVPTHEIGVNFSDRHVNEYGKLYDHEVCKAWPHGFMYWKKASYEDVFYNCKYILKDEKDEKNQRKPGMSKKPPLGAAYFAQVAEQYVKQGISPQDLFYRLPGIKKKKTGQPIEFLLQGRSAELFLEHFIQKWHAAHGERPWPPSDLVDNFHAYGRVVHDEMAMLEKRDNPSGRSYQPAPRITTEVVRTAERIAMEKGLEALAEGGVPAWWKRYLESASDGEERQKRKDEFVQWQFACEVERKHKQGFKFITGKGWVSAAGPGPCDCGYCGQPADAPDGQAGRGVGDEPDYGLGPVGRHNQLYPRTGGTV